MVVYKGFVVLLIICRVQHIQGTGNVLNSCSDPGLPVNGVRTLVRPVDPQQELTSFPLGSQLNYSCEDGFELRGWYSLVCLTGGKWSSPLPTCTGIPGWNPPDYVPKTCIDPGPVVNGEYSVFLMGYSWSNRNVSAGEFNKDTYLLYKCDKGYMIYGDHDRNGGISCTDNGLWSSQPLICVEDYCGRRAVKLDLHEQNAVAGEWPWMVGVATLRDGSPTIRCGGVLLNNRTVLSAATCFLGNNSFRLLFGKYRYSLEEDDEEVVERTNVTVKIHPNFDPRTHRANIAVVSFSPSISYSDRIRPICLPSNKTTHRIIPNRYTAYVTSWGVTEDLKTPDSLQMSRHRVVSAQSCRNQFQLNDLVLPVESETICAESSEGQANICHGDAGSPMVFFNDKTGRYIVEGLVSLRHSGACGRLKRYTVFTQVAAYAPWIMNNTS